MWCPGSSFLRRAILVLSFLLPAAFITPPNAHAPYEKWRDFRYPVRLIVACALSLWGLFVVVLILVTVLQWASFLLDSAYIMFLRFTVSCSPPWHTLAQLHVMTALRPGQDWLAISQNKIFSNSLTQSVVAYAATLQCLLNTKKQYRGLTYDAHCTAVCPIRRKLNIGSEMTTVQNIVSQVLLKIGESGPFFADFRRAVEIAIFGGLSVAAVVFVCIWYCIFALYRERVMLMRRGKHFLDFSKYSASEAGCALFL